VPTYAYRCAECGPFELSCPMGSAAAEEPCARCDTPARRVFTPPLLARTPSALARALGAQEASAHEPRVVERVPPARRRTAPPVDPRLASLPRP
jgi:putative FmdB family regulatory protein